jgi:hypothetical protein
LFQACTEDSILDSKTKASSLNIFNSDLCSYIELLTEILNARRVLLIYSSATPYRYLSPVLGEIRTQLPAIPEMDFCFVLIGIRIENADKGKVDQN